ncbi:hypothetical protein GCM10010466_27890 [Planomonospora alba]|uniref:Peptidase C51 domain-containing protein n=1 Tax=Planomonospora alba TaxID=161354 RepID=A0ABP6N521_9ACTN
MSALSRVFYRGGVSAGLALAAVTGFSVLSAGPAAADARTAVDHRLDATPFGDMQARIAEIQSNIETLRSGTAQRPSAATGPSARTGTGGASGTAVPQVAGQDRLAQVQAQIAQAQAQLRGGLQAPAQPGTGGAGDPAGGLAGGLTEDLAGSLAQNLAGNPTQGLAGGLTQDLAGSLAQELAGGLQAPGLPAAESGAHSSAAAQVRRVVSTALARVGEGEKKDGTTSYGTWYDRYTGQKGFAAAAWCDMFLAWVGVQNGVQDRMGVFAYTPWHAEWFDEQGRFDRKPKVGDLVFFDWAGSRSIAAIDHVGLVTGVNPDGSVTTVEGNISDRVVTRTRTMANIVGFGHPAYGS